VQYNILIKRKKGFEMEEPKVSSCGVTASNRPFILFEEFDEILYYYEEFIEMSAALDFLKDHVNEICAYEAELFMTRSQLIEYLKEI
jgi:hypothetical protein